MTHYIYAHRAGYGRDDHMADEIIARAARRLDLEGAGEYIAQTSSRGTAPGCQRGSP